MAGEKRSQEHEDTMLSQTTILVDIEGTTTSISFVKETLFPYVRANLKKYLSECWDNEKFKEVYNKLKEQAKKDEEDKVEGFVSITGSNVEEEQESLIKNVLWQMDNDRKTNSLKQLQGNMWHDAYKTGVIKGRVYDDVPKSLELWVNNGKKIYVYSSGSVESQKLHFGHSEHGDLLKYFSGFFDTEVGAKQECNSYKNILTKLGEKANNVIFLTDVVKEAAAAKEAGILPIIVTREGNAALTDEEAIAYMTIKSFLDLTFQTSTKRQKLNPTEVEKKDESVNPNSSEPMDTSEDVEIPVENAKEIEKTEITKSPQPEQEIKTKTDETDQTQKDESEIMKDVKDVKDVKDITVTSAKPDEKEQSVTKQPETPTKVGATSVADDAMAATKSEPVSKPETDDKKCTKSETVVQNETTNAVKDNKTREENVSEKPAETETKAEGSTSRKNTNSSTTEANSAEGETISKTTTQISSEIENAPLSDATKTDDVTAKISTEEANAETENKNNDTKKDSKDQESNVAVEKSKDGDAKVENQEESKNRETKENADVKAPLPKAEKHTESAESIEQESSKESVKEETVSDEVKDKSTVESEKKKLNGTTQNGDDVPVSDENLHRNGLNEGSSSEQLTLTSSEEKPAQNGEPESSTDTSAESIKVKKVVDSAVADGAGEPDVVPPVVVAATS
ncbi:hypothetical protein M0804_005395 [Polistes exclamans]|nr:hypothetical protein M0804_005395 [Polistes exclamans]